MNIQDNFRLGSVLDSRYEVKSVLSFTESRANVLAYDLYLDRLEVYLKLFQIDKASSKNEIERFRTEVLLNRKLSHPAIESVYDIGRFNDFLYISGEVPKGEKLSNFIKRVNVENLKSSFLCELLYQLLHACGKAHEAGIIHRNITSECIYIEENNGDLVNLILTNFSLGKDLDSELSLTKTSERAIDISIFQSPEQLRGESLSANSDLYSIGMILYDLISGGEISSLNNQKQNALELFSFEPASNINIKNKNTPSWFLEILENLTKKDKRERAQSSKEAEDFILKNLGFSFSNLNIVRKKTNFLNCLFRFKKASSKISHSYSLAHRMVQVFSLFIFTLLLIGVPAYFYLDSSSSTLENVMDSKLSSDELKLLSAVNSNNENEVFSLVSKGVNPLIKDGNGIPLIHLVVLNNNPSILYTLLSKSSELNKETLNALINEKDSAGMDSISLARKNGLSEMESLLRKFSN